MGRIGFDQVAGYLENGIAALESRPDLVEETKRITALALAELLESSSPPFVLDVRSEQEWRSGHIPGSRNMALNHLREQAGKLPTDESIVVHCRTGYRSSLAASILQQEGIKNVLDVVGGSEAWTASNLATVEEAVEA